MTGPTRQNSAVRAGFSCGAALLAVLLGGCAEVSSTAAMETPALRWTPPDMPHSPPALPALRHFGLRPPFYPNEERSRGLCGEVLLEVIIGRNSELVSWRVVRTTTAGFAREVLATMSNRGRAPGVSPGVYSYSVVFHGDGKARAAHRPGTLWIATDNFGR